jgi:hypothetical protein
MVRDRGSKGMDGCPLTAEYTQKDYLIQQHIFRTVADQMMLQISHHTTGAAMWKEIKTLHEGKSALVKVDI